MSKGASDCCGGIKFKVGSFTLMVVKAFWNKANPRAAE